MDQDAAPTIHAAAVLVGRRAVLIRGPSGAGKSRLALALIIAADSGLLRFARLIGDDRVHVEAVNHRLLVRPAGRLAGLIEVRGLGLRTLPYEPVAVVGLVVDLAAADAERLPQAAATATVEGVTLPRLAVAAGIDPMPHIVLTVATPAAGLSETPWID
jgi:serine kinase of HPr protein (carbohydrate metabolism regulator)